VEGGVGEGVGPEIVLGLVTRLWPGGRTEESWFDCLQGQRFTDSEPPSDQLWVLQSLISKGVGVN
jgi:hypothetical protein